MFKNQNTVFYHMSTNKMWYILTPICYEDIIFTTFSLCIFSQLFTKPYHCVVPKRGCLICISFILNQYRTKCAGFRVTRDIFICENNLIQYLKIPYHIYFSPFAG